MSQTGKSFWRLSAMSKMPALWHMRIAGFLLANSYVWLTFAFYRYTPYYRDLILTDTQKTILLLAILFSLYSAVRYFKADASYVKNTRSYLASRAGYKIILSIYRFLRQGPFDYTKPLTNLTKTERSALLFGVVKIYFIPMMINFTFGNLANLRATYPTIHNTGLWTMNGFSYMLYPIILNLLLVIDTGIFSFGYITESGFLRNKLRSVEPTILGWSVVLLCYPPFNGITSSFVPFYGSDYPVSSHSWGTFAIRLSSLLLMAIYVSASVALGTKASNLTNRGIVGYGPYRYIRHPAYISKNLAWWVTMIPVLKISGILGMAVWSSIYFMRAITEERHLSADPDYKKYCKKVKYRFIPKVI